MSWTLYNGQISDKEQTGPDSSGNVPLDVDIMKMIFRTLKYGERDSSDGPEDRPILFFGHDGVWLEIKPNGDIHLGEGAA